MRTDRHLTTALGLLFAATAATLIAQTPAASPLAPFGVSEATVRAQIVDVVSQGLIPGSRLVETIMRGYERVPVALRAQATTAAFAWAKSFVNSPAFTTPYAQFREEHRPQGAAPTMSLDAQVQKDISDDIAMLEESRKNLTMLKPADRAVALKGIDDAIARLKSPEHAKGLRQILEATNAGKETAGAKAAAEFEANWPADQKVYVRKKLEYIMAATANVDFTLPQIWVKNPAGRTVGFLHAGLQDLPWESVRAIVVGKEAVDAARAAMSAWLQELNK